MFTTKQPNIGAAIRILIGVYSTAHSGNRQQVDAAPHAELARPLSFGAHEASFGASNRSEAQLARGRRMRQALLNVPGGKGF